MVLKKNINIRNFLSDVHSCTGEVTYRTLQNDCLNLKSELCKYLFLTAIAAPAALENGDVICAKEEDYILLAPYLEVKA